MTKLFRYNSCGQKDRINIHTVQENSPGFLVGAFILYPNASNWCISLSSNLTEAQLTELLKKLIELNRSNQVCLPSAK